MNPRDDPTFAAEYDALLDGCGYHVLAEWSVVTLAGADRQTFLHNMCTNDIRKLNPGEGCEAFCTDVKGKIVAHVFVLMQDDRIVLLTVPGQAERIIRHLERYIIREDVQLADATSEYSWIVLAGQKAAAQLPSTFEKPWANTTCQVGGVQCVAVRFPLPGRNAILLSVESEGVAAVRAELAAWGATVCGEAVWTSTRVEGGLPLFGVDFDESNSPQEVARDTQAISFTKGCYLGQETIARLDALGHVNKQIVSLKFAPSSQPMAGTPLTFNGQPAGTATSVGWSPRFGGAIGTRNGPTRQ